MNKTAFVTGASRGIGRAIAIRLAEAGYNLSLVCEKREPLLNNLAHNIRSEHANIRILTASGDISSPEFVEEMRERTEENFGAIDVLINNAGISYVGLLTDMSVEDWDRVMNVNLRSCFLTSKAFLPGMINKKSGKIINISSIWGQAGASCEVCYSASKGGMDSFTKALAKEVAPSGISVNAISCGVIDTDMNDNLSDEEKALLAEEIPAGRFGKPDEVAKAVITLLNTDNYLTGQIIGINGGFF